MIDQKNYQKYKCRIRSVYIVLFQKGFSNERLISSSSKYSRYICLWQNKGSSFHFLSSHLLQYSKMTDRELLADKKGRVELGKYLIHETWAKNWKQIFVILKVRFHHEGGLSESRYFELFFSTRYEAPPHKKSAMTEPPFLVFQTFGLISSYFVF